jgi:histidinol-phosphate aminotransferase
LSPFDEVVVSESAFLQYRIAAELMGARAVAVPQKNMRQDLMGMSAAVTKRTKFIFIANPNNPTGTYNTRAEVDEFLSSLPGHVVPVFDEAYYEYAEAKKDYPSVIEEFFRKRPVVVLRTFSKAFGLAGLRVGYGVAPEGFVRTLDKIKPPFNVSVPAQFAAAAALFDEAHIKRSVKMNETEKERLAKELTAMNFTVVPSAANFLLFQVKPWTGRLLFERLLREGVVARSVDEYGLPDYLRVTVGRPDENKIFLKALREVVNGK